MQRELSSTEVSSATKDGTQVSIKIMIFDNDEDEDNYRRLHGQSLV